MATMKKITVIRMFSTKCVFIKRRLKFIILIAILIFCGFTRELILFKDTARVSCYHVNTGDALPPAEEPSFSPSADSIFFHETSCKGGLNSRQACAVESAARAHPLWQIHVLFSAPVTNLSCNEGSLKILRMFNNVKLTRLHINEYVKGSPVEGLVSGGALNSSKWPLEHTSDMLRLVTLYKWSGVYLDLDVVVARPLAMLGKNWAARDTPTTVGNGALAFSSDKIGRMFAAAAIREFVTKYRGDEWGYNGPGVIQRVLRGVCSTSDVIAMSAANCGGFQVYGPQLYPVAWKRAQLYFEPTELNVSDPFTYHLYSSCTSKMKVVQDSSYARLANIYCPAIYAAYGDNFGT